MRRRVALLVIIGLSMGLLGPLPVYAEGPTATVHEMWVEYNVVKGGRKGMVLHARLTVAGCKDVKLREQAFFQYQGGQGLKAKTPAYSTPAGYVTASQNFTPRYPSSDFKDLGLFMPYDELNMSSGEHKLQFNLAFYVETGTSAKPLIGRSEAHLFTLKKP